MRLPREDDDPDVGPAPDAHVVYREPARSYVSVAWFVLLIGAGFCLDLSFGGGVAHLPGWILALVLVVGINVFVVYAARITKSLTLTDDELWVGEEVIPRAEIVGAVPGVDRELPCLGWPHGSPRGVKGMILTLLDGRNVLVPTRYPGRLEPALAVGAADSRADEVRVATEADRDMIAEIDERAEAIFRVAGYELPHLPFQDDELAQAKAVFVYGNPPVGFAWLDEVDGLAHLQELAVIPRRMRAGIGGRLLERACAWASAERYPAITLTTYADVPWNAPWYAARGFVELRELTPGLRGIRVREANLGLDEVGRRVAMRRELPG